MSHKAPYHYFLFFLFLKGKEGSLAHKFARGKGEDNGVDHGVYQASFKEVSPYRKANDRKAKLPKFEQSVLIFKLSPSNDRTLYGKPVRGGTNS